MASTNPPPAPSPTPSAQWPEPVVVAKDELKDRILMLGIVLRPGTPTERTIAFPYADLIWVAGAQDAILLSVGNRAEFEIQVTSRSQFATIIDNLRYGVLEILRDESPRPAAERRLTIVGFLLKGLDEEGNPIREPI